MAELTDDAGNDTGHAARQHWDGVWATRPSDELSWHQQTAEH